MSETTSTIPCPRKAHCSIPASDACTADQLLSCGMVDNSPAYIATLLSLPEYMTKSSEERAAFLTDHFGVYVDEDEISGSTDRIIELIHARIAIKRAWK